MTINFMTGMLILGLAIGLLTVSQYERRTDARLDAIERTIAAPHSATSSLPERGRR